MTVSSPYDTPQRYCDAFKVMDAKGKLLGERVLWHDHQTEQPFTRDLHGVVIPADLTEIVHWDANGWRGELRVSSEATDESNSLAIGEEEPRKWPQIVRQLSRRPKTEGLVAQWTISV